MLGPLSRPLLSASLYESDPLSTSPRPTQSSRKMICKALESAVVFKTKHSYNSFALDLCDSTDCKLLTACGDLQQTLANVSWLSHLLGDERLERHVIFFSPAPNASRTV